MKRPNRPRDAAQLALAVVEESTSEDRDDFETLAQAFWEETGVIAPGISIPPPLTDQWGEDVRWERWRAWILRRKMGGGKERDRAAAGRKGGLKGGKARAVALSPERRREIARKAASARWAK